MNQLIFSYLLCAANRRERLLEEMLHEDLSSSVSLNSTEISSAGKVQDNTGTERYSDADQ